MSSGGVIAGCVAAVIICALSAAGFWFYRAWKNEEAKKKTAGKWSGALSTGNSTLVGSTSGAPQPPNKHSNMV